MAATRGLERGRTDQAAVDAAFQEDLRRWVDVQQTAGLDFFSDGLLRWQDIFRPLVEPLGLKPHTLVRWFDTNTFFRQSELTGPVGRLTAPHGIISDDLPQPKLLTLPSPYLFSRAMQTTRNRNQLMQELAANVLRPVIEAGVRAGVNLVHLEEPWIPYEGIAPEDWGPLGQALQLLHDGGPATLVLHLYFGDAAPHLDRLRELPVDAFGVDLLETDLAALGPKWDKGLVAGIVGGRDSTIESLDQLIDNIRYLGERVQPPKLYLTSNCELSYLPTQVAERKVARLGEAARRLRELVAA